MIAPTRWIEHLQTWLPVAAIGEDAAGVHQVRVAARRVDAWLRLGEREAHRDELRWLREELATARDLDVLLEGELPEDFRVWLALQRAQEQVRVATAARHLRTTALVDALRRLPALEEEVARAGLARVVKQVRKRGRAVPEASPDPEDLHRLRRALRRLRFSLEWLGERSKWLVPLQDAFGALNDRVLLLRWLDAYPHEARHEAWRSEIHDLMDRDREAVTAAWERAAPHLAALG